MDKSQQFGFDSKANQVPPANMQAQPRELLPMISQVIPPAEQTLRAEEFRSFIINMYTPQATYLNLVLNIVTANGCNNYTYQEALTNYLQYCASFKMSFQNDYGRNAELHSLLVRAAMFRTVDVKNQFKFWVGNHQNDTALMGWVNQENQNIRGSQFVVQITATTKASVDKRQQASGMGFGGGMGNGSSNNLMGQPQNGGMMNVNNQMGGMTQQQPMMNQAPSNQMGGMVQNNTMGMTQAPQNNTMGMGSAITPAQPVQQAPNVMSSPTVQPVTPEPTRPMIRRDGHRLFLDTGHPETATLIEAQLDILGGWAINPKASGYAESDFTKFTKYNWVTKYGSINESTRIVKIALGRLDNTINELGKENEEELTQLLNVEVELDFDDANSPGYWRYVELLKKQDNRMLEAKRLGYAGIYLGTEDICTIDTKPWGANASIGGGLDKLFTEDIVTLLEPHLHVTVINSREYYLIDSSDPFINTLVTHARTKTGTKWSNPDNTSQVGHYYLINCYVEADSMEPHIEDFYDRNEHMDPSKYALHDSKPKFTEDNLEGGEPLEIDVTPRLRLRDMEMTVVGNTPVELAETMRTDAALNRTGDWHSGILVGKTKQPTYVVTVSKNDKSLFNSLQKEITDGTLNTLSGLGVWLNDQKARNNLTLRMERLLDSRITKELNILFNEVLAFGGMIIEDSFMGEYEELIEIINDSSTPGFVEALYRQSEVIILQRLLLSTSLRDSKNKDLVDYYKATSPYNFTTKNKVDTFKIGSGPEIVVGEVVNALVETTRVYAVPLTIYELGLNPHAGQVRAPWTILPTVFLDEIKRNFVSPCSFERVSIVTKDNYTLTVSGTNDEMLLGTVSVAV